VAADTLALPKVAAPTPDDTELPLERLNRLARNIIQLHEIIHRLYERERLVDSSDETAHFPETDRGGQAVTSQARAS
jgi:hypothetical protein